MLSAAKHDTLWPILMVKVHHLLYRLPVRMDVS